MRWPLLAFFGCLLISAADGADRMFPYRATITSDDVYVRSGPGDNYYPTDKLKLGDEIEVYRHDPGGWYAIRPPKGSFSWISSKHLQLDRNHLATITEDRIAARVGSRFSDIRDVIQVRLHRDETVEILEGKLPATNDADQSGAWIKIAPPAGEFRWVSGRYVDAEFPKDGVRRTNAGDAPIARPDRSTHGSTGEHDLALSNARTPGEPYFGQGGGRPQSIPARPRTLSPEQYQHELDDIDLEISTLVIAEPSVWDFSELHPRAEALFNQADTAIERGRARMLMGKIARFEDIKTRYDSMATMREEAAKTDRQLAKLAKPLPPPPHDPDGRYDAMGRLGRVTDPKPGAPQYAILDPSGNVRCYVSPAPGVNLRSYVGREVGITGIRGYMPEQQATHIMARHVSLVDGTMTATVGGSTLR